MTGRSILKSGRVLEYGEPIPDNDPMVGLNLEGEPSCWTVGIRPRDAAVLDLARKGGIAGLSWGAYIQKEKVEE